MDSLKFLTPASAVGALFVLGMPASTIIGALKQADTIEVEYLRLRGFDADTMEWSAPVPAGRNGNSSGLPACCEL